MSCEITTKIAKHVKRIKYGLLNKIVERNINEYKVHAIRKRIIAVIKIAVKDPPGISIISLLTSRLATVRKSWMPSPFGIGDEDLRSLRRCNFYDFRRRM